MTFQEIAIKLGLDERTVRRDLERVLAKLRAGLDPDLDLDTFSGAITAYYEIPRRFSNARAQSEIRAPRVSPPADRSPAVGGARGRAGHLSIPRRFSRGKPKP